MARRPWKLGALVISCIAIGAAASAIANAGAATSAGTTTSKHAAGARAGALGLRRLTRRAIAGDVVVAAKGKFVTVTFARGTVSSVSGQQLTIAEGTKKATYRTVTVTLPTSAKVRYDRRAGTMSDLTPGKRVTVIQAPQHTWVLVRG